MSDREVRVRYVVDHVFVVDEGTDLDDLRASVSAELAQQPAPANSLSTVASVEVAWEPGPWSGGNVLAFRGRD
jgi:hypothetical protein